MPRFMLVYSRAFSSSLRLERCRVEGSMASEREVECLCWEEEGDSSWEMSARARFLVFLLWVVKMEGLAFGGRARAALVGVLEGGWARREES